MRACPSVHRLDKTDAFSIRRATPLQTPYFVNPSFARNYARDYRALAQVEAQADQQYFKKLEGNRTPYSYHRLSY